VRKYREAVLSKVSHGGERRSRGRNQIFERQRPAAIDSLVESPLFFAPQRADCRDALQMAQTIEESGDLGGLDVTVSEPTFEFDPGVRTANRLHD
jgi:hypothetical protein